MASLVHFRWQFDGANALRHLRLARTKKFEVKWLEKLPNLRRLELDRVDLILPTDDTPVVLKHVVELGFRRSMGMAYRTATYLTSRAFPSLRSLALYSARDQPAIYGPFESSWDLLD
ncbi:hypothetical protein JCM8547_000348 [Rhodosporidiobolus lusitaniae]